MEIPGLLARTILAATLMLGGFTAIGAAESEPPSYAEAIREIVAADSRLATVRNQAPENMPIARAVENYVAELDALALEHCPPDFVRALQRHRDAWQDSIEFFEQYAELRGEMHDVVEMIRATDDSARTGLELVEARIWSTWAEVEQSMNRYLTPGSGVENHEAHRQKGHHGPEHNDRYAKHVRDAIVDLCQQQLPDFQNFSGIPDRPSRITIRISNFLAVLRSDTSPDELTSCCSRRIFELLPCRFSALSP